LEEIPYSVIKKAPEKPRLFSIGAGNETRTRDPNLGKVVLYQLSYSRVDQKERVF
jgi:hypothetical protein